MASSRRSVLKKNDVGKGEGIILPSHGLFKGIDATTEKSLEVVLGQLVLGNLIEPCHHFVVVDRHPHAISFFGKGDAGDHIVFVQGEILGRNFGFGINRRSAEKLVYLLPLLRHESHGR